MLFELGEIFINVVTPVFALVIIGYVVGGRLQLEARTLSRLAYFVLVPAFVFNVLSTAEVQAELVLRMVAWISVTQVGVTLLGYVVARLMGHTGKMVGAFMLLAVFGNVGNFGLPLIEFRLGPEAILAATIYFMAIVVISFVIGVAAVNWSQGSGLSAVVAVAKTPALVAAVPAVLLNAADVHIPLMVSRIVGLLGSAMVPIMLLALGVQLVSTTSIRVDRNISAASLVRLVGSPLVAIAIVGFFGVHGIERGAGLIQAGMPAAVLCSIIALEHDCEPDFVTKAVLFSTIASVVTLTILLTLI